MVGVIGSFIVPIYLPHYPLSTFVKVFVARGGVLSVPR